MINCPDRIPSGEVKWPVKAPQKIILNNIQSLPKFHSIFFIIASLPPQNNYNKISQTDNEI